MQNGLPIVHCVYAESGKDIPEILEEAFRQYLRRILAEGQ